jgi:hypothetical protein
MKASNFLEMSCISADCCLAKRFSFTAAVTPQILGNNTIKLDSLEDEPCQTANVKVHRRRRSREVDHCCCRRRPVTDIARPAEGKNMNQSKFRKVVDQVMDQSIFSSQLLNLSEKMKMLNY